MTLLHQQGLRSGPSVEATIPDQLSADHPQRLFPFIDQNRLVEPSRVTAAFNYLPVSPSDDAFTPEEQLIFALAFLSTPKIFDNIAEVITGRTREDCIKHYYATKWDGRFKTKTMEESVWKAQSSRQEGLGVDVVVDWSTGSTGSGKQTAKVPKKAKKGIATKVVTLPLSHSAEEHGAQSQKEEVLSIRDIFNEAYLERGWKKAIPPLEQEISRLSALCPATAKAWHKRPAWTTIPTKTLPHPNLSLLRPKLTTPKIGAVLLTDNDLSTWLRSMNILPLIKSWKLECLDNAAKFQDLQRNLPSTARPWNKQAEKIAEWAFLGLCSEIPAHNRETNRERMRTPSLVICAKYAAKIVHGDASFFADLAPLGLNGFERHLLATLVLFTAYDDITRYGELGFFGVLLQSPLAGMLKSGVREKWEAKYLFEGEKEEDEAVGSEDGGDVDPAVLLEAVKSANTELSRKLRALTDEAKEQNQVVEKQAAEIAGLRKELAAVRKRGKA